MASELTLLEQSERKVSTLSNERECTHDANKLHKGIIVYKIDTGMAHEIVSVSFANGIEHYSLVCSETRTNNLLSKFALERFFIKDSVKLERFGLKMVKRLSAMLGK